MSRIVFYHPSPRWNGVARVYTEIGRALAARGVTAAMACPAASAVAAACTGLEVLPFDDRDSLLSDALRLAVLLREFGADAVMVNNESEHLLAAFALRRNGRGVLFRHLRFHLVRGSRCAWCRPGSCMARPRRRAPLDR